LKRFDRFHRRPFFHFVYAGRVGLEPFFVI
jgi:hypothetical protein